MLRAQEIMEKEATPGGGCIAVEIVKRNDSSWIEMETSPEDYSASRIARAVEDADTHLVDMISNPGDRGEIRVMLRVRREDPSPVVHSLERYGYTVLETGSRYNSDQERAALRWLEFQNFMHI